jgi:type IV pilus assembly protein PilV
MHQSIESNSLNKSSQQGVVLLEVLISVLILSLGILALVGLQAAMIKNTTNTKMRADASYFAQQQIGRLWANPANAAAAVSANVAVAELPDGLLTITQPSTGQFVIRIGWTAPGESKLTVANSPCGMVAAHCFTTTATIVGG